MQNNKVALRFGALTALIILAALSRMIPHPMNFAPMGAMALFGAAHFTRRWQAFAIPLVATWLSDLFINNVLYAGSNKNFVWFYEGFYWQYAAYLLITLCGLFIFSKISVPRVLAGALCSTGVFFLLSNFGVWFSSAMYPQSINGLITCYVAGIPFIKGTLLGDVFYSAGLFGTFYLLQQQFPKLQTRAALS